MGEVSAVGGVPGDRAMAGTRAALFVVAGGMGGRPAAGGVPAMVARGDGEGCLAQFLLRS